MTKFEKLGVDPLVITNLLAHLGIEYQLNEEESFKRISAPNMNLEQNKKIRMFNKHGQDDMNLEGGKEEGGYLEITRKGKVAKNYQGIYEIDLATLDYFEGMFDMTKFKSQRDYFEFYDLKHIQRKLVLALIKDIKSVLESNSSADLQIIAKRVYFILKQVVGFQNEDFDWKALEMMCYSSSFLKLFSSKIEKITFWNQLKSLKALIYKKKETQLNDFDLTVFKQFDQTVLKASMYLVFAISKGEYSKMKGKKHEFKTQMLLQKISSLSFQQDIHTSDIFSCIKALFGLSEFNDDFNVILEFMGNKWLTLRAKQLIQLINTN
jgi:hypothetical protein